MSVNAPWGDYAQGSFPIPNPDFANSKGTTKPRVLTNDFGDGYSQRSTDGLNPNDLSWDLQWTNLTTAEWLALKAFFNGLNGSDSFLWQAFDEDTVMAWTVGQFDASPVDAGYWIATASIKKVNDQ